MGGTISKFFTDQLQDGFCKCIGRIKGLPFMSGLRNPIIRRFFSAYQQSPSTLIPPSSAEYFDALRNSGTFSVSHDRKSGIISALSFFPIVIRTNALLFFMLRDVVAKTNFCFPSSARAKPSKSSAFFKSIPLKDLLSIECFFFLGPMI